MAWQSYIWHVTHGEEYQHPAYSYQRAPYYYANVTYGENSSLKDPFQPELGRSKPLDLLSRIVHNAAAIPIGLGESCWFGRSLLRFPLAKLSHKLPAASQENVFSILEICLVVVGVLALIGAVIMARQGEWFLSLYFGLTLAVVTLTPWQSQFWRYLGSIAPLTLIFLVVTLVAGGNALARHLKMHLTTTDALIGTFVGGMLLVQASIAVVFLRNLLPVSYYDTQGRERLSRLLTYEPHWHALDRAFEWVRRNGKTGAIVATSVPQLAYLRTQHKAVLPPFEADAMRAMRLLNEVPASYLILDELRKPPISDRYAAPLMTHQPTGWNLVYTAPGDRTAVYERTR